MDRVVVCLSASVTVASSIEIDGFATSLSAIWPVALAAPTVWARKPAGDRLAGLDAVDRAVHPPA